MRSLYSSASVTDESSVEPTRSQKTTVRLRSSVARAWPIDSSRAAADSPPVTGFPHPGQKRALSGSSPAQPAQLRISATDRGPR